MVIDDGSSPGCGGSRFEGLIFRRQALRLAGDALDTGAGMTVCPNDVQITRQQPVFVLFESRFFAHCSHPVIPFRLMINRRFVEFVTSGALRHVEFCRVMDVLNRKPCRPRRFTIQNRNACTRRGIAGRAAARQSYGDNKDDKVCRKPGAHQNSMPMMNRTFTRSWPARSRCGLLSGSPVKFAP